MILSHYLNLPCHANHHLIVDDFGNISSLGDRAGYSHRGTMAWNAAYRFAKGQSFEQAGMLSAQAPIPEH